MQLWEPWDHDFFGRHKSEKFTSRNESGARHEVSGKEDAEGFVNSIEYVLWLQLFQYGNDQENQDCCWGFDGCNILFSLWLPEVWPLVVLRSALEPAGGEDPQQAETWKCSTAVATPGNKLIPVSGSGRRLAKSNGRHCWAGFSQISQGGRPQLCSSSEGCFREIFNFSTLWKIMLIDEEVFENWAKKTSQITFTQTWCRNQLSRGLSSSSCLVDRSYPLSWKWMSHLRPSSKWQTTLGHGHGGALKQVLSVVPYLVRLGERNTYTSI